MSEIKIEEVLNNGIRFLINNPILILLSLVSHLLSELAGKGTANFVLMIIIWYLIGEYVNGLSIRFIYESRDKKPSWKELCKFVLSKFCILVAASIIFYLALVIGFVLLIIPGIYLGIRLIFFDCTILLEDEGIKASFKRSWEMTREYVRELFPLFFIICLPFPLIKSLKNLLPAGVYDLINLLVFPLLMALIRCVVTFLYLQLREIEAS